MATPVATVVGASLGRGVSAREGAVGNGLGSGVVTGHNVSDLL